jgi:putative FmdB family regulatory protein
MPIFEYRCQSCAHEFEQLILGATTPQCPACESQELEKLISLPRVQSSSTRAKAMRAAKSRDKVQATDRMQERMQYEESHDRHG